MEIRQIHALCAFGFALVTPTVAAQADAWTSGTAMPTPRVCATAGAIGSKIYVVGGATTDGVVSTNEVYDTRKNRWTTAAPMPTARWCMASDVVGGVLYVIGGRTDDANGQLNVVEAYNPATDSWTTKSAMPTTRDSITAAVIARQFIYVVGGYVGGQRLATVEAYDTAGDSWSAKTPLNVGKSLAAVGAVGTKIIAAGGLSNSGDTADNEIDITNRDIWRKKAQMPTARQSTCASVINGLLYVAGGSAGGGVLEAYDFTSNSWNTALTPMPLPVGGPASATVKGRLYCFGGADNNGIADYVQIYQP